MRTATLLEKARAWLPVLPLLLLLLATWWLNMQVQPLPQKQGQLRHDVDYSVDRFAATTLDAAGKPRYTITAERLWHYPDDDSTHLLMPQLIGLSHDRPPMRTTAQTGMVSSKGDEVFLYDEVRIVRPLVSGLGEQRLATDYLHMIPDRDWADTDQAVVVSDPHNTLRAVGMELDNQARTLKLLSRVRANHVPIQH